MSTQLKEEDPFIILKKQSKRPNYCIKIREIPSQLFELPDPQPPSNAQQPIQSQQMCKIEDIEDMPAMGGQSGGSLHFYSGYEDNHPNLQPPHPTHPNHQKEIEIEEDSPEEQRESAKKKAGCRRNWKATSSIIDRKFQITRQTSDIFDREEMDGPIDECKLWKNLMNKHISTIKVTKKKKIHKLNQNLNRADPLLLSIKGRPAIEFHRSIEKATQQIKDQKEQNGTTDKCNSISQPKIDFQHKYSLPGELNEQEIMRMLKQQERLFYQNEYQKVIQMAGGEEPMEEWLNNMSMHNYQLLLKLEERRSKVKLEHILPQRPDTNKSLNQIKEEDPSGGKE